MDISENVIKHYDLYKSYSEFNFLFEDTIQQYRLLIITLIRISYKYSVEEDNDGRELTYPEQDRLLKIMMNNMGASDIVNNCKACFIDFFKQQKEKNNCYIFEVYDEEKSISEQSFEFALEVFEKTRRLYELRNIIIHSHYSELSVKYQISREDLRGQKDVKYGKGYQRRNYVFSTEFLQKINEQIRILQSFEKRYDFFCVFQI